MNRVIIGLSLILISCSTPAPLLPTIPTAIAPAQKKSQANTLRTTKAIPKRTPASNNPGDLAQFALKGEFTGTDEKSENCELAIKGWGNDGAPPQKEYHEFKVTGFDSMIRTQFWAKSVERNKNSFKSKFVLFGNHIAQDSKKSETKANNLRVFLTVYLDDDQQTILGYNLITDSGTEKKHIRCTLKAPTTLNDN